MKGIKNIGILAHVDAGKTTITENFLYLSDAIKAMGSVNHGSSVSDSMALEKERGISIQSVSVSFSWKDFTVNLIDTPGHTDFSAEVERALAVMDGVILVISAVEGVQSHTITLWEGIKKSGIPCLFFINKIDRPGADFQSVMLQIEKELKAPVFPFFIPEEEGENSAYPLNLFDDESSKSSYAFFKESAIETLAEKDEEILNQYLEGDEIGSELLFEKASHMVHQQQIVPLYCGTAKYSRGIESLLDGVIEMLPDTADNYSEQLGAIVFKLDHDKILGKLAHVRVFSGNIKSRDLIVNFTQQKEEKVAQLKKVFTNKKMDTGRISSGDIGIITGFQSVQAGDILGNPELVPKLTPIQKPVITVQIKAINDKQYAELAHALSVLNTEDPLLGFKWFRADKEMHLNLMGMVQIEVLESILEERFDIKTEFSDPTVIYKETPAVTAEATIEYTMPKPCWAVMRFRVEPGIEGSGIIYRSEVSVNDIHRKYQNEIEATIPKALEQGIKGWEVTDIKITLIGGEDHEIHSRPGDFILATPMGIMKALERSGTKFLEPVFKFDIKAPETFLGNIVSDLTKMRGSFDSPEFEGEQVRLKGFVPVSTSLQYHIRLSSLTAGKGIFRKQFGGYRSCADEYGKTREYNGVNPLNTSQWILHKRGAYK